MLPFGSILCSLISPHSTPHSQVLIFSSLIYLLNSFLCLSLLLNTKLAQSAPAPTNPNQLSVSNDVLEPTLDTPICHSTLMDVKNAFLNGTLSKKVYMKPSFGTFPPAHKVISDLQHYLGQHFEMKDIGSLNYFLGFEVSWLSDVRNKVLSLIPVLNQNIVLLLMLPQNSYSSLLIWVSLSRVSPFFIVTIIVSSKLLTTMSFMSVQST
ncbi:putative mitochondrial protein [Cucumis melo var. makuwa]|uniref:Mitochondrial protein n=1 Tax=Cucumis melo var. makuwa TaxID=1194695 RepID=A0A5A7UHR0_CUCMM|nr:putative mitochondrial protein [Cucumis melo var. makuwa]TYK29387.1 putative mitochondrial protein [Cucumis melo var. makuwa]